MNRSMIVFCGMLAVVFFSLVGCGTDGQPTLLPNADPTLRKTSTELAADAAKRTFEADAPKSDKADARAQYDLGNAKFDLANLSETDWQNVEVWVNQTYVLLVPKFAKGEAKKLEFELFYDRDGHHFDTEGGKNPFKRLQIYRDGTLYDVTATLE